jgi:hypothetical protein
MTSKSLVRIASLGAIAACVAASAHAASYTIFDPPGSVETFPRYIDASGIIVGDYSPDKVNGKGFIRAADGTITVFRPKGSEVVEAVGIDGQGRVSGSYVPHKREQERGFVRAADGTITRDLRDGRQTRSCLPAHRRWNGPQHRSAGCGRRYAGDEHQRCRRDCGHIQDCRRPLPWLHTHAVIGGTPPSPAGRLGDIRYQCR